MNDLLSQKPRIKELIQSSQCFKHTKWLMVIPEQLKLGAYYWLQQDIIDGIVFSYVKPITVLSDFNQDKVFCEVPGAGDQYIDKHYILSKYDKQKDKFTLNKETISIYEAFNCHINTKDNNISDIQNTDIKLDEKELMINNDQEEKLNEEKKCFFKLKQYGFDDDLCEVASHETKGDVVAAMHFLSTRLVEWSSFKKTYSDGQRVLQVC